MIVHSSLAKALVSPAAKLIEDEALPQYIAKRRWFGLKDQPIKAARITHLVNIGDEADGATESLGFIAAMHADGAAVDRAAEGPHEIIERCLQRPSDAHLRHDDGRQYRPQWQGKVQELRKRKRHQGGNRHPNR
jgi:hypothetical protein